MHRFEGNTLVLVNPAAKGGKGKAAGRKVYEFLSLHLGADKLTSIETQSCGHAEEIARNATGVETIVCVGGDGLIHETVNGLMKSKRENLPVLGVVPMGSGNDYARSLNLATDIDSACEKLILSSPRSVDIGCVNEHYFMETLSFGVDAAIALQTMTLRTKRKSSGALLYAEAGIDQLINHLDPRAYRLCIHNGIEEGGECFTFAIQIGPYYGGGFKICPDAQIDDGILDVCITHPPVRLPRALFIFAMIKGGHHTRIKQIEFRRTDTLKLEFIDVPPAQMDGEAIIGTRFDVGLIKQALKVLY